MSSHQESTITESGVTFKVVTDITVTQDTTHVCPAGQHWDNITQQCVADQRPCPPGEHWDPVMGKCVGDIPAPDPGLPAADGWVEQLDKNANQDPLTWKVVPMTKDPALSKVVDNNNVNRAVEFKSNVSAQQYIDHFIWLKNNPTTPPPDHTCPTGQHWDDVQGKCVDDTTPPPPGGDAGVDKFGVKKIYADDPAKATENWYMSDLTSDSRVSLSGSVKDLGNGVFEGHVTTADSPASFRINVRTTNPKAFDLATQQVNGLDWSKKKQLGYMVDSKDFRNCEMTIYWNVTQWSADDEMSLYFRGGHHTDGWPVACLATDNKGQIQRAGNSRFAKEYHHFAGSDGYVFQKGSPKFQLSAREKVWTGQKFVQYDDGQKITMEVWADESGSEDPTKQNWKLMNTIVDDGNFGQPKNTDYMTKCKATAQQPFLWGGPAAVFRIDNVIVQVKKASVRHIKAP